MMLSNKQLVKLRQDIIQEVMRDSSDITQQIAGGNKQLAIEFNEVGYPRAKLWAALFLSIRSTPQDAKRMVKSAMWSGPELPKLSMEMFNTACVFDMRKVER